MDTTMLLYAFNGLLGLACFLLKTALSDLKEECKSTRTELYEVKDKYFKKEDFTEFKKELWARLDRMEDDFKLQLKEIHK